MGPVMLDRVQIWTPLDNSNFEQYHNVIYSGCILETGKLTALLLADISYSQTVSQLECIAE